MLCFQFGLPTVSSSYIRLEELHWSFGQKLVTDLGTVYWATETQYATSWQTGGPRRDCLIMHGTEDVTTRNGVKSTALCCQCVCFIRLGNLSQSGIRLPRDIQASVIDNHLTLILVRWFSPHNTATERCSRSLPICPQPFHLNHALWRYAQTDKNRPILLDQHDRPTAAYRSQSHMFGKNPQERMKTLESEAKAYYGLVKLSSVQGRAVIFAEFEEGTDVESDTWLQTVAWH
jgi:hypothetical protein